MSSKATENPQGVSIELSSQGRQTKDLPPSELNHDVRIEGGFVIHSPHIDTVSSIDVPFDAYRQHPDPITPPFQTQSGSAHIYSELLTQKSGSNPQENTFALPVSPFIDSSLLRASPTLYSASGDIRQLRLRIRVEASDSTNELKPIRSSKGALLQDQLRRETQQQQQDLEKVFLSLQTEIQREEDQAAQLRKIPTKTGREDSSSSSSLDFLKILQNRPYFPSLNVDWY